MPRKLLGTRARLVAAGLSLAAFAATPQPVHEWPAYLGEGAAHYSEARQITTANVAGLQKAWEFHTGDTPPGGRSEIQCNPLIVDGVLYGTSSQLTLFALDAATGKELWRYSPDRGRGGGAPGTTRGFSMWREGSERRLMFTAGRYLYAIDPATGKVIATFGDQGRVDLLDGLDRDTRGLYLSANAPGAIYRDLIIMGTRVGEGPATAAPGHIRAYDVRTGKRRWIFHTIPHPGEFGHETWSPESWKHSGGANCWAGLVVDAERGLAFVPTGSAAYDFWGGDRVGDNLFANCLIALDAATGQRKWHFQFVHHDLWDYDLPAPPVLCEVTRDGKKIAAVAQVTKTGQVWVFNRETGESLFPWREVPVPQSTLRGEVAAKTQPMPLKPAPFARQHFSEDEVTTRTPAAREAVLRQLRDATPHRLFDPPSERGTVILPGFHGGAEWGGPAVDSRGVLYVNSSEMPWLLQMVPTAVLSSGPKELYAQLCLACHGADRKGNALASIPDLTTIAARQQPEEIAALLLSGKGMMPSFRFLSEPARAALVQILISPDAETATKPSEGGAAAPATAGNAGGSPYVTTGYNRFLDPEGYPAVRPPWGTLNAIDLNTGEYLWKRPLGETPGLTGPGGSHTGTENYGGPVVTAGGVLFIAATKDEKFRAFSAATGEILWETKLPAGGYATPATYEAGGRQFVVIACGGGKMGTKPGDSYVAFALPPAAR